MKLISLYIENFGGLHQYALDFEDGLTVIQEANGFGKTTLAEFIRAMFYGFPRKGKTLDKSRRQKYTPWNAGKFGGNLVFQLDGSRYRVERSFGATPKGDSFALIDLESGKKSSRFSEELGLELFRLDADSFERSTYLPQMSEGQVMTTDSIRSKLSNLVEDTNDVGNFEKAVAALKAKRSTFVPYRGSGGTVAQASGQISGLQDQIHRTEDQKIMMEEAERSMVLLRQEQEAARSRQEQLRAEIRLASEAAAAKAIHGQYRKLEEQHSAAEAVCREFEIRYPAGVPEWTQIEEARNAAARLEILNSRVVTEQDDLDAIRFVEENRKRFDNRTPTAAELADCRNRCQQRSELGRRTMELAEKLTRNPPVQAKPWPMILLLLTFVGETGLGISLLPEKSMLAYAALAVGAVTLVFAILAAVQLMKNRKRLQQFHREQTDIRAELDRLTTEVEGLSDQIQTFLSEYGVAESGNFYAMLVELEHDTEDYLRAKTRVAQWQREKDAHEAEITRWNRVLDAFFGANALTRQENDRRQLLRIRDDRKDWEEATEDRVRLRQELEAFCREHEKTLAVPVPENLPDPDVLHREETALSIRMNEYAGELIRLQQRKDQLLSQIQQLPQLREELRQWQEKKTEDQKKSDLLDETMALLEQAKENLSGSYLGPIRRSFGEYLGKLWQEQEGQVLVTADLDVQLERFGEARELGYFSAGQADMIMLGMRFALVDALFREEKPFVILDDPFVNLDDSHTAQGLELLKSLSQEKQIIYLTCTSSRAPK